MKKKKQSKKTTNIVIRILTYEPSNIKSEFNLRNSKFSKRIEIPLYINVFILYLKGYFSQIFLCEFFRKFSSCFVFAYERDCELQIFALKPNEQSFT